MTYIPDTRKKMIKKPFAKEEEENHYWEGYLDRDDKKYVSGYDIAADDVLGSIFTDLADGEIDLDVEGEDIDLAKILVNHPEIREKLHEAMQEHFESQRDELIVSMIDGYSEEKYDQLKKVADATHKESTEE